MPKPGSRVRSAKGKIVDFDLLKIKQQIAGKPVNIDVKARQNFIDQKARRRIRKQTKQVAAAVAIGADNEALKNANPTEAKPLIETPKQVHDLTATPVAPSAKEDRHSKQKVRPPVKTEE